MDNRKFNREKLINYWIESSDDDFYSENPFAREIRKTGFELYPSNCSPA